MGGTAGDSIEMIRTTIILPSPNWRLWSDQILRRLIIVEGHGLCTVAGTLLKNAVERFVTRVVHLLHMRAVHLSSTMQFWTCNCGSSLLPAV
ncbi:hypothetical protein BDZ89DRAFT_1066947 [Hymenopellis radicata]|nr:hypothetical protein BDZ89DRAFT_1066947 [Hymenopellis radicata]